MTVPDESAAFLLARTLLFFAGVARGLVDFETDLVHPKEFSTITHRQLHRCLSKSICMNMVGNRGKDIMTLCILVCDAASKHQVVMNPSSWRHMFLIRFSTMYAWSGKYSNSSTSASALFPDIILIYTVGEQRSVRRGINDEQPCPDCRAAWHMTRPDKQDMQRCKLPLRHLVAVQQTLESTRSRTPRSQKTSPLEYSLPSLSLHVRCPTQCAVRARRHQYILTFQAVRGSYTFNPPSLTCFQLDDPVEQGKINQHV